MSERSNVASRPARRAGAALAVVASSLVALTACRGARESNAPAPAAVDHSRELATLRERLNELTKRLDELFEQQTSRLSAIEARATQLEAHRIEAKGGSGDDDVATVHAELAQLRRDLEALGVEQQLDRIYRERLERIETSLATAEHPKDPSVDDIWNWYVGQRDKIRRLADQLTPAPPHP